MGFYKSVIIGFALQLAILLAIVAMILSNQKNSQEFPATVSNCPDFYEMNAQGNCIPQDSVYSVTTECSTLNSKPMTPSQRKTWAANCGVAWDGISNNHTIK
jgi:hypothetical protein